MPTEPRDSLRSHQLQRVWAADRKGICARCGEVRVKSAGSDRRGGIRWRCANQVTEYRRAKAKAATKTADAFELILTWPCCGAEDRLEPPNEIHEDGSAREEYEAECPACGLQRSLHVAWYTDDDAGTVETFVGYVETAQHYTSGVLQ